MTVKPAKAVLFDPSLGTSNLGDLIIRRAIERELEDILNGYFVVRYGTHTPLATFGSIMRGSRNQIIENCQTADLKLICGTNILKEDLFHLNNDWVLGPFSARLYSGAVLVGAGLSGSGITHTNLYTRKLYKRALSLDYVHSVRDERTATFLQDLGFRAINTGCPTTWKLDESVGRGGPRRSKPDTVLFTLTDYAKDRTADEQLIRVLLEQYHRVIFWPQGVGDLQYFTTLGVGSPRLEVLQPRLESYLEFINSHGFDYIGTRLHGGILAQEHGARVMVIAVDNRARDMALTAPIVCIEREKISALATLIGDWPRHNGAVRHNAIQEWKQQFKR